MKLVIKRDQQDKKGFFGGHKGVGFTLKCHVDLTPLESELIARYKAGDTLVAECKRRVGKETFDENLTVDRLVRGVIFDCDDVGNLMANEEEIKRACKNFKLFLAVMATFGGEEVIEFEDPRITLQREREAMAVSHQAPVVADRAAAAV